MIHAWLIARTCRRRVDAEGASLPDGNALRPGPAVLRGTIEDLSEATCGADVPAGGPAPLAVEVEQLGEEIVLGGRRCHRYLETSRRVTARPFHLRLASGERVRVEPGARPELRSPLERVVRDGGGRRRRIAEVPVGSEVHVRGELRAGIDPLIAGGGGYRDPGVALVLGAPDGGRLVCSREPLDRRWRERAEWYTSVAVLFAVLLGVTQIGIYGRFYMMQLFGAEMPARTTELRTRWPGPGARLPDVAAVAIYRDAKGAVRRLRDEVRFDELPRPVHYGVWRVVPFWPTLQHVGHRPRISIHLFFWVALLTGGMALGHIAQARRDRRELPWHEVERVDEEGLGPLPADDVCAPADPARPGC